MPINNHNSIKRWPNSLGCPSHYSKSNFPSAKSQQEYMEQNKFPWLHIHKSKSLFTCCCINITWRKTQHYKTDLAAEQYTVLSKNASPTGGSILREPFAADNTFVQHSSRTRSSYCWTVSPMNMWVSNFARTFVVSLWIKISLWCLAFTPMYFCTNLNAAIIGDN